MQRLRTENKLFREVQCFALCYLFSYDRNNAQYALVTYNKQMKYAAKTT